MCGRGSIKVTWGAYQVLTRVIPMYCLEGGAGPKENINALKPLMIRYLLGVIPICKLHHISPKKIPTEAGSIS